MSTPDALALACLRAGVVFVNAEDGTAYTTRRGATHKKMGCKNLSGYIVCTLHWNGQRKQIKLHRLIWLATWGEIPDGYMPDHKNRIKDDNRVANLRLVTAQGNAANRRSYRGEGNPAARLTPSLADAIRSSSGSYSAKAAAFNVSKSLIAQISRREIWN